MFKRLSEHKKVWVLYSHPHCPQDVGYLNTCVYICIYYLWDNDKKNLLKCLIHRHLHFIFTYLFLFYCVLVFCLVPIEVRKGHWTLELN